VGAIFDRRPWGNLTGAVFGAGDIEGDKFHDLLVVTPDGKLYAAMNTPFPAHP